VTFRSANMHKPTNHCADHPDHHCQCYQPLTHSPTFLSDRLQWRSQRRSITMDSAQANERMFSVRNGVIFKSTANTYKNFKQLMVMFTRSPVSHQLGCSQLHLSNYLIPYKIHFAPLFRPFWQVKCNCHKFTCSHLFALVHRPVIMALTRCVIPSAHCQATSQRLVKDDNGQDVHRCRLNC
jgi:hypothetical protein